MNFFDWTQLAFLLLWEKVRSIWTKETPLYDIFAFMIESEDNGRLANFWIEEMERKESEGASNEM